MRVSKEKAAQNRHDMLTAAARLFREQGVSATGVDAITKDASLTHGAVYRQPLRVQRGYYSRGHEVIHRTPSSSVPRALTATAQLAFLRSTRKSEGSPTSVTTARGAV
jgi:hypothetical protein